MIPRNDLSLAETFGLTNPTTRIDQIKLALGGDDYTPSSKWGLSSLGLFMPRLSVKTWLGWRPEDRRVLVFNFFNHTPTPVEEGWSVRKTQVTDFRGGTRTYDSHNGTDFGIPIGTIVCTPAPGVVRRISDEFHRGGLKITIDHGGGLITVCAHLGRAKVRVGDAVERGQPIALSAYSGLDGVVSFPWIIPHVHFNTWLNGQPVDPFAGDGEVSLWRERNAPTPYSGGDVEDDEYEPPTWDLDALAAVIEGCVDPDLRAKISAVKDTHRRAVDTIFMKNYFPTRFECDAPLYAKEYPRTPRLDLPFSADDYDGSRLL